MRTLLRHKREVHVGLIIVVVSIRIWYLKFPVSKRVELWTIFIYASVSGTVSLNYSIQ